MRSCWWRLIHPAKDTSSSRKRVRTLRARVDEQAAPASLRFPEPGAAEVEAEGAPIGRLELVFDLRR